MNTKQLKSQLREILALHAYDIGDLSDRIGALFAEFEAQPLAVVVPAIQWEQDPEDDRWWYSKAEDIYAIKVFGNKVFAYRGSDKIYEGLEISKDNAITACQAHKEAAITKHLEGCNVVIARDAGVLVDALKSIVKMDEARSIEHPDCEIYGDSEFRSLAASYAKSAVDGWEAGK